MSEIDFTSNHNITMILFIVHIIYFGLQQCVMQIAKVLEKAKSARFFLYLIANEIT